MRYLVGIHCQGPRFSFNRRFSWLFLFNVLFLELLNIVVRVIHFCREIATLASVAFSLGKISNVFQFLKRHDASYLFFFSLCFYSLPAGMAASLRLFITVPPVTSHSGIKGMTFFDTGIDNGIS